ncbi:MAG: hypothetical protein WC291_05435 [Thermodesulfovibrionales bacterium]|jgi:hypothetical protein
MREGNVFKMDKNGYYQSVREKDHRAKLPSDMNQTVWRYMDFWKLEDMLRTKSLYLCRADQLQLSDKYEGTYSRLWTKNMEDFCYRVGQPQQIQKEKESIEQNRRSTFINCWCMNDHDLDLMWKAYIEDPPGIAIQSTVERLEKVLDNQDKKVRELWPLDLSIVTYYDQRENGFIDYPSFINPFLHKDWHFELDNEIRIIAWNKPKDKSGIKLPLDLNVLITKIVMSPNSTEADTKRVRKLMDEVGLSGVELGFSRYRE